MDRTLSRRPFRDRFAQSPGAITTDASVRYAKLKTGECQAMAFPKPADVALMKSDPNITLVQQNGLNVGYIAF